MLDPRFDPKRFFFVLEPIRASGLVERGDGGVVMVSGGADSVCMLGGLTTVAGSEGLVALHVNYGLRDEADRDEQLVRELCSGLGVELEVVRAGEPEGNVQGWARDIRHREAERLRAERGLDWIAVGHNRTDQVETFLYRLASSPGTRPLLVMPPRSGRLIRPLLALDREFIRSEAERTEVRFVNDATNDDLSYARNRIRHEVIPALEQVNPAARQNILRTRDEMEEDEDLIGDLAGQAIADGIGEGAEFPAGLLLGLHPAVQRRVLRRMAEGALGRPVAIPPGLAAEAVRLAGHPEGGVLDLGGGDVLSVESGLIGVNSIAESTDTDPPAPVTIPARGGKVRFGGWSIEAELIDGKTAMAMFGDPFQTFFGSEFQEWILAEIGDIPAVRAPEVRVWGPGDRVNPIGLGGSRSLQDVFTDAKVPRSKRRAWPVVWFGDRLLWVPGLVRSTHCLVTSESERVLRLEAKPPFAI
ncbi:MAG: tRNA lysidine(34) synthetase TilS [Solirubrobacterales bacterium]|nr:tRNA lysidine(34) synthetase TilS [Solirubrobacterales bacterium]HRV59158.1 tRNA lysidine(34) synthetase TilS [Solirubrobacterales bacterium]